MALPVYLAMTAAEMRLCASLPPHCCWMACHFSPYGLGLSNLPAQLPPGSMLIVNDRTPVQGHDPDMIAGQLRELVDNMAVDAVLLDLQRPRDPRTAAIVKTVAENLPCPVGVTQAYAEELDCCVFLDAVRPYHALAQRIQPWQGRQLWLDASFSPGTVTVTAEGSCYTPCIEPEEGVPIHHRDDLFCSYHIQRSADRVDFHLYRTADDLRSSLDRAEALGITRAIGLYQELGTSFWTPDL